MIKLTLVTPEKKLTADAEVEWVSLPALKGELNILEGHVPMMTTLTTGVLRYKLLHQETAHRLAVSGGYVQVYPGGVNVLAEFLEAPEDIQKERSKKKVVEIEEKMGSVELSDVEWAESTREVQMARAELEVLGEKF